MDFKKVVDYFVIGISDITEFGCVMHACKQLFQITFQNSHVEFTSRQINGVDHVLAKVASFYAYSHLFTYVPSYICILIANKMN